METPLTPEERKAMIFFKEEVKKYPPFAVTGLNRIPFIAYDAVADLLDAYADHLQKMKQAGDGVSLICQHCGKYKTLQGNGMLHQLCECATPVPPTDAQIEEMAAKKECTWEQMVFFRDGAKWMRSILSSPGDKGDVYGNKTSIAPDLSLISEAGRGGWVSVRERLPEIGKNKRFPYCSDDILLTNGKKVVFGTYEKHPELGTSFLDHDGNDYSEEKIKITHWQPLPTPPKAPAK